MRVGLVSPYDFASPGGVNDHVRHLARQLRHMGHETRVFAPSSRADVDLDSNRFYRIGSPIAIPVNDSVARITLSFHLANRVAAIIEQEHFDVLHFHEPLMPALPMTMLRMSSTANVGTFHAFARSNVGYYYGRPLLQPYLGHLHRAIAVSEPARAFVNRYFPEFAMRVIPNGEGCDLLLTLLQGTATSETDFQKQLSRADQGLRDLKRYLERPVAVAPAAPQTLPAGDRNLTINGVAIQNQIVEVTGKTVIGWTPMIHRGAGNVAVGDGSMQQMTTLRFRDRMQNSITNRLAFP